MSQGQFILKMYGLSCKTVRVSYMLDAWKLRNVVETTSSGELGTSKDSIPKANRGVDSLSSLMMPSR
jgi:hypothetical protein